MKKRKGFTLIELMVVVLIVGILAAVAIPIMRGRVDEAKWSEANATAGTIRTAVRAYVAETNVATAQADLVGTALSDATLQSDLGFEASDLTGVYFAPGDYTITSITADGVAVVSVTNAAGNVTGTYVLESNGDWTKQ